MRRRTKAAGLSGGPDGTDESFFRRVISARDRRARAAGYFSAKDAEAAEDRLGGIKPNHLEPFVGLRHDPAEVSATQDGSRLCNRAGKTVAHTRSGHGIEIMRSVKI